MYTFGIGYIATTFLKNSDNFLERNLMRIGFGLATLPTIFLLFSYLRIPIDWRLILIFSLIAPVFYLIKNHRNIKINLKISQEFTKSNIYVIIVLILFFASLFMYAKGAFIYPYLEDDDSWAHTLGIKYVATEKTVFNRAGATNYLDPYPPAYDSIFGLLHQTSPSISWTIKFFNALIVSLSIIFFYFFVKEFTSNREKALFATFVLAVMPSYLSHFIWSHAFIPGFFFLAFYSLERIKYDKKWIIISTLTITAIFLTQITQSIKFVVFFLIYFIVKSLYNKKFFIDIFSTFVFAFLISLLWWATRWKSVFGTMLSYTEKTAQAQIVHTSLFKRLFSIIQRAFPADGGTATRAYTFDDFFIAKSQNLINNPIGFGIAISILLLLGIIYLSLRYKHLFKKENSWITITFFWLLFTFLGVNSLTFNLPVGLFAFRFWMLLAIPVSILAAEGMWFLFYLSKLIKIPRVVILAIVILGLIFTSGIQKYTVNTAVWGPGAFWTSMEEIQGFLWMKENLPLNTKVFTYINEGAVIGSDMYACRWCEEERVFKNNINTTAAETHSWLKAKNYEYLIIEGQFVKKYDLNTTNIKIGELANSNLFIPVHQTNGFILFKLK